MVSMIRLCTAFAAVLTSFLSTIFVYREKFYFIPSANQAIDSGDYSTYDKYTACNGKNIGIVFAHGNAGTSARWDHHALQINQVTGSTTYMVNYPGYGRNTSTLNMHNMREVTQNTIKAIARLHKRIVLVGISIGGAIIADAATSDTLSDITFQMDAIILMHTFPSMAHFMHNFTKIPLAITRNIIHDYNTLNAVKILKHVQFHVINTRSDELIPWKLTKAFCDHANVNIHESNAQNHNNYSTSIPTLGYLIDLEHMCESNPKPAIPI